MKYLVSIIMIMEIIALQSCIDCGPQAELTATVEFIGDSVQFDSIYALKALDQKAIPQQPTRLSSFSAQISLPISLVSDTTTYLFKSKGYNDTLSIFYERIFRYKGGCGFINDVRAPSNGNRYQSTFKQVEVSYSSYVLPGKQSFLRADQGNGIVVRIKR